MYQDTSDNICRICLNVQDTLFSLYRKRLGTSPYEKLIRRTKLNIQLNDSGPPSICSQCLIDLDTTVSFLEKCERSNQLLSAAIRNENSKSNSKLKNVGSESDTKMHETNSVELNDFEELKTSALVFPEEKCAECGSKRRCKHWAPPTVHTCQYCQKTFNKKYNYQCHVARHVGAGARCGACGARVASAWAAARHCARPARRACPAPGCARSFTTNTNLRTHLRTHTGEKPFECDDCGKSFISKNILNNHMRIHTGVKPYMCQICGKQFTTNKLAAHVASHGPRGGEGAAGGAGACPCARCGRCLPSPRALREHARTHSTQRTHRCVLCDSAYKFKQSLNYHVKTAHGGTKPPARPLVKPSEIDPIVAVTELGV